MEKEDRPNSVGTSSENDTRETLFPIVGIGASAGGLEAMEIFFSNMPGNSPALHCQEPISPSSCTPLIRYNYILY